MSRVSFTLSTYPLFRQGGSFTTRFLRQRFSHLMNKPFSVQRNRCGENYAWRQFEGHRCTMEIVDNENPPYEFDKKCDDPGVRDGYTFPIFR